MKKRRHHFVWKDYLSPWLNEEKIWVSRKGENFNTNPINIAVETDFYKLRELTRQDIDFIKNVFKKELTGSLAEANQGWLNSFQQVFTLRHAMNKAGHISDEINEEFEKFIQNSEEDLHQKIEDDAYKFMVQLRQKNCKFFSNIEDRIDFSYYLANQYLRTKKLQESWIRAFSDIPQVSSVNLRNCWGIGRHIMSTQVASGIFNNEKFKLIPLVNNTSVSLITGDQPVLNTFAVGKMGTEIPSGTEFYYPVSPNFAIMLSSNYNSGDEIQLTEEQVWQFNLFIYDAHHEQIFANSSSVLSESIDRYHGRQE